MRATAHPFRRQFSRQARHLIIGAVAVLALSAGVATAGDDRPEPTRAQIASLPDQQKRNALLREYIEHAAELRIGRDALAAAKRSKKKSVKLAYGATVDGNDLYFARVTVTPGFEDSDDLRLPMQVIRKNRTTGAETIIMQGSASIVVGLAARNGTVALSLLRISGDEDKVDVTTTLAIGSSTSEKLAIADVQTVTLKDLFDFCGDVAILGGLSDDGEALVSNFRGTCGKVDTYETTLLGIRDAGNRRVLLRGTGDDFVIPARMTGGRLLARNPFERAAGVADPATGAFTNLWSPGMRSGDIAGDGTVALIGTAARAPIDGPPGEMPRPARSKYPFVVFPEGDADRPIFAARSAGKVSAVRYCGSNLYVLKPLPGRSRSDSLETLLEAFGLYDLGARRYSVQLYGTAGGFVRELAKTPAATLSSIECSGDRLALATIRGANAGALEYGP